MCGIVGGVALRPDAAVTAHQVAPLAAPLRHRGPDDAGTWDSGDGRCALAFQRLAIIDLATGNQPLSDPSGQVHVVFNGEIYNFRALRGELSDHGVTFRTQGDAEVIAAAYHAYGPRCFERFFGMFAIALWDTRDRSLILARDRFGKKPLVYTRNADRLLFASELKALLVDPAVPRTLDLQSLHRYLTFQYVPDPHAIYRDIAKVPPGCFLVVRDGAVGGPQKYWRLPTARRYGGSYDDAKQELNERLEQAVARRLVADVPLGAFLSGGVDSSIIVAMMRRLGVEPLRTFSIGFDDPRYDETSYAHQVADRFQTTHHVERVTPDAQAVIDTLAFHYDEPFADSSAIPTYYLAQVTRAAVTVALTGDAGDECFLGYDRYRAAQFAQQAERLPALLRQGVGGLAQFLPRGHSKSLPRRLYRLLSVVNADPADRYLAWINLLPPSQLRHAYRPDVAAALDLDEPRQWFRQLYDAVPHSPAERANWADFHAYLPFDLLTKVDRASMAASLECRVPFLDHELVEFAVSLPPDWRMGKRILKDLARDLLPPEILRRPKMGFGVPLGNWFRHELRPLITDALHNPDGLCHQLLAPRFTETLLEAHLSGRDDHSHALWALLMLERWYRRWQPTLP
jgi:asparagine synthase (glutamine-hydrolysing)